MRFLVALVLLMHPVVPLCAEEEKEERPAVVQEVKLHPDGEPNGFRGKALELLFVTPFKENDEVRFVVVVTTKDGLSVKEDGFVVTPWTSDRPGKSHLINLYLAVPRGDPEGLRQAMKERMIPGNIASVSVKLTQKKKKGFFSTEDVVIADFTKRFR